MFVQLLVNGLIAGCGYGLVALGFALIYGATRTFHFAHGAVYTLSAYLFFSLQTWLNLTLLPAFFIALGLAALLGILIDKLLYIPLVKRNSSLSIQLLSSLAFYIVATNFAAMIYGSDTKVLSPGIQPSFSFASVTLTMIQIVTFFSFIIVFAALWGALRKTSLGRIIRAIRDDPELISALGINLLRFRTVVFAIGSILAAWAAILRGLDVGIEPNAGLTITLTATVAVIIGGIGIFEAAAFGAVVLGILQSLVVWQISSNWQEMVTFLVLIVFLLFRPQGMFNYRRRIEEVVR
jgi:branched-chain amino acid transport system permease protein